MSSTSLIWPPDHSSSPGFNRSNTSVGTILHQLGPDCSSSNVQAIKAIIHRCRFGYSEDHPEDTNYIRSSPINEDDFRGLISVRPFTLSQWGGQGLGVYKSHSHVIFLWPAPLLLHLLLHTCVHVPFMFVHAMPFLFSFSRPCMSL